MADAFAAFATELRRIEFPATAQAEAAELGDLADRISGSLPEQAAAGSPEEYQRLAADNQDSATPSTSRNELWSARYPAKPVPCHVRAPPVLTLRRAAGSDCVAKVPVNSCGWAADGQQPVSVTTGKLP